PNWFAPSGYEAPAGMIMSPEKNNAIMAHNSAPAAHDGKVKEVWSFRRSNYFEHVGTECQHTAGAAGLLDMTAFAKFEVSGPGAADWLESLVANRVPTKIGRMGLCHMLSLNGGVRSEFTIYKEGPDQFYLVSAGAFERHDFDYLRKHLPTDGSVSLQKVTTQYGVLVLAGPRARDVLQPLTDWDLSNEAFPWLTGKTINVGHAMAKALRVNFVGELGWELHHPIEMQNTIFDLLMETGAAHELRPFGIRAMDSMRVEKSYRLIPRELSIEYSALESGLDRFVRLNKPEFIGRDALVEWQQRGFDNAFATLEVDGITHSDPRGNEAIYINGELAGRATSGSYGWRTGKTIALGMLPPEAAVEGQEVEIEILGARYPAKVVPESPYDPQNAKLRG
ncbi:MAG: aminomethyltransferase family protein, partial [Pseudomonadota bacterium]